MYYVMMFYVETQADTGPVETEDRSRKRDERRGRVSYFSSNLYNIYNISPRSTLRAEYFSTRMGVDPAR
jgi:hypothetical protein